MGGFVAAEVSDGQLTELHCGRRVQRVVLEDEQGVEQLVVTGDAVNLGQRQVFVVQRLLKVVVQLAQQAGDGGLRGHVRAHRHGVDQQAHHRFDAGHIGRASRDRGAEDDVALPGQRHQQLRPRGPQHGVDGGVMGARQVVQRLSGLLGEPARLQALASQPLSVRRSHQRGGVEAGQHFSPAGVGGVEVSAGLPGHEPPVRRRRGQLLLVIGGEDFLQQDRQGRAVEHDVVGGEHEPVAVVGGANQRHPEGGRVGQFADRGAFGGGQPLDAVVKVGRIGAEIDVMPRDRGVAGDDLHGWVDVGAEAGREVGVAAHGGVDRLAQPVRVEGAGDADVELEGVQVDAAGLRGRGVKVQPLLQRGQRQDVGDVAVPLEEIDLLLGEKSGGHVRRGEPPATAAHVRADAPQCLKPQLAQARCFRVIQNRRRPRPVGVQPWAALVVQDTGVERHGMGQRHGHRGRDGGGRQAVEAWPPHIGGELTRAG